MDAGFGLLLPVGSIILATSRPSKYSAICANDGLMVSDEWIVISLDCYAIFTSICTCLSVNQSPYNRRSASLHQQKLYQSNLSLSWKRWTCFLMMNALDMISLRSDVLLFEQVLHLNPFYMSGYSIHLIVPPLTSDLPLSRLLLLVFVNVLQCLSPHCVTVP
jgi:hypothetical protein